MRRVTIRVPGDNFRIVSMISIIGDSDHSAIIPKTRPLSQTSPDLKVAVGAQGEWSRSPRSLSKYQFIALSHLKSTPA